YQLLHGHAIGHAKALAIFTPPAKSSVEQAFKLAIQYTLQYWQQQEELALINQQTAPLLEALHLVRQCFYLWGSIIPRKASHTLRQQLDQVEHQFITLATETSLQDVVYQASYLTL